MEFDSDFYLNYYKDLRLAGIKTDKEALLHYTTYGKKEGRYSNSKQLNPHITYNNFNPNELTKQIGYNLSKINDLPNINEIIIVKDLINDKIISLV